MYFYSGDQNQAFVCRWSVAAKKGRGRLLRLRLCRESNKGERERERAGFGQVLFCSTYLGLAFYRGGTEKKKGEKAGLFFAVCEKRGGGEGGRGAAEAGGRGRGGWKRERERGFLVSILFPDSRSIPVFSSSIHPSSPCSSYDSRGRG